MSALGGIRRVGSGLNQSQRAATGLSVLAYRGLGTVPTFGILDLIMPPSTIFQLFKKNQCRQLQITTTLDISPATFSRLKGKEKGRAKEDLWFARTYPGEGKLKVAHSFYLRRAGKKNIFETTMFWFLTENDPPPGFLDAAAVESDLAKVFGEREVDVVAQFSFDKNLIVSLFHPIDIGEQSQILDEIIGFTGVKRDREGKILYTMQIGITDKSIEQKLSFRQTVKLEENTPIALLETAGKLSALAIKPKEAA